MLINRDVQTAVLEGYGGKNDPIRSAVFFHCHSCSSTKLEVRIIFIGIKTRLPTNLLSQTGLNYSEKKTNPQTGTNLHKPTALTNP